MNSRSCLSIGRPIIRRFVSFFRFFFPFKFGLSSENSLSKNVKKLVKKFGILFKGFQDLLRMFLVFSKRMLICFVSISCQHSAVVHTPAVALEEHISSNYQTVLQFFCFSDIFVKALLFFFSCSFT